MYIALIIGILLILVVVIPIKITIDYEFYSKDYDVNNENIKREFKIYILRFIKIKTLKQRKKEEIKNKENSDNKVVYNIFSVYKKYKDLSKEENLFDKLHGGIKFKEIDFQIGYNLKNYILNSYVMAILNYYINSYIAKNSDNFDLKKVNYNTYISDKLLKIKIKGIVNLNLAKNIFVIIKLIFKFMKGGKNNGKKTSNRKFNDDCYDVS